MLWKPKKWHQRVQGASYQGDDNKVEGKIIVTMCVIENSDEVAPLSLGATCTTKISRTDARVMK